MAQPLTTANVPTDVYGGDEVSAIVLDAGYCHTRAGFAGEDVPKSILPSFYSSVADDAAPNKPQLYFGDEYIVPRKNLECKNYMSRTDAVVEDWDSATKMWEYMMVKRLQADRPTPPSKNGLNDAVGAADGEGDIAMEDAENEEKPLSENPVLMTETPWNQGKAREKAIEIFMENFDCPAFWLSRTPVCAAFSAGKATALVVDVGGACTSVTAVHDGMLLKRTIQKSPVGGLWLSSQIRNMFESSDPKVEITPHFSVKKKTAVDAGAPAQAVLNQFNFDLSPSFRAYENERVLTEFKECVVEVWRGPGKLMNPGNDELSRNQPGRTFEMPDGANQIYKEQRFRVSEGMWDDAAQLPTSSEEDRITKAQTIPEMIKACILAVDVDLRATLLGHIVVTGGTSLVHGFNDRLNNELTAMFPGMRIKLHSAGLTTERRFGAWIGGSILASLGTFHQMWISKKEYEENGAGIVEKRCK